jgi:hypothetical protein
MSPLLDRLDEIRLKCDTGDLIRISVLFIGLVVLAVVGLIFFSSPWPAIIVVTGWLLGFLFQKLIVRGVAYYSTVFRIGLIVYGIVLFVGDQIGLSLTTKCLIITITSAIVFNLQYWSISDPSVGRIEPYNDEV